MRMGMVQLFVINLTSIGLNVLFVVGLDMDVTGVALASVIAQWVGLAVMLWIIFRHRQTFPAQSDRVIAQLSFDKTTLASIYVCKPRPVFSDCNAVDG